MKLAKRIAAAFLAAVMAVSAFAVCASAESIYDTAKEIKSGVTKTVTGVEFEDCVDYKVNVTKSGTLSLKIEAGMPWVQLFVYDSDGNMLSFSDYEMISGRMYSLENRQMEWNSTTEKVKMNASYSVSKGTYYIRVYSGFFRNDSGQGNGKVTVTATYPSASVKKAKISYLTLTVNKGNTVNLGAVLSGSGSVSWSSSKSSVASVTSSGKVTAKAKGSAIITAKCGSSNQKIKIIVK